MQPPEQNLAALLTALSKGPAPAPVSRVTAAGLAFIDCTDYTSAFKTLQTLAIRNAHGPHAPSMFYVLDSALKQVQRQKEEESLKSAIVHHLPLLWAAVSPLLDATAAQRITRLFAAWERANLLPPLNLSMPSESAQPPLAPYVAPPATVTPPSPAAAAHQFPPGILPAHHKPAPPPHFPQHHHPHGNADDDDGGDYIEPFSGAAGGQTGGGAGGWNAQYLAVIDSGLEFGDKILLPASALQELTMRSVKFPILLQLRNPANNMRTYAGVREFSAPEGRCVLPRWVLNNVEGAEGRRLHIRTVELPLCTYAKLRPLSTDFARVTDPKALLEALLRYFSALTVSHTLHLHGAHSYDFVVAELQPADAVCIIDTTMEVEFEGIESLPEASVAPPVAAAVAKEAQQQGWRQGSGDSWARDNPSVVVKSCGNCGSKVPQDKWALHEAVCYRQNFGCPKCGKKMKISDKAAHLAEAHAPVQCSACGADLEAFQLEGHTAKECPARLLVCHYCSLSFQARAMLEHEAYCGSRTEVCEQCGKRVTLANADAHRVSDCIKSADNNDRTSDS